MCFKISVTYDPKKRKIGKLRYRFENNNKGNFIPTGNIGKSLINKPGLLNWFNANLTLYF